MKPEEIIAIHERYVGPGFGTTTPDELVFIQDLIKQHRPKRFLEIGTASGFSTGVIARMLEAHGGRAITSIDLDTQFFGDTDKESGFLARAIYQGDKVEIKLHTKVTAFDLEALGGPWDMAFVDANHQHPWPVLDTLALAPHLNNSRIVIHHDLQLFRRFKAFRGVGPRLLFNEVPDAYRQASGCQWVEHLRARPQHAARHFRRSGQERAQSALDRPTANPVAYAQPHRSMAAR